MQSANPESFYLRSEALNPYDLPADVTPLNLPLFEFWKPEIDAILDGTKTVHCCLHTTRGGLRRTVIQQGQRYRLGGTDSGIEVIGVYQLPISEISEFDASRTWLPKHQTGIYKGMYQNFLTKRKPLRDAKEAFMTKWIKKFGGKSWYDDTAIMMEFELLTIRKNIYKWG